MFFKETDLTSHLEVDTTTLGGLEEEGAPAGFELVAAGCCDFEDGALSIGPSVTEVLGCTSTDFLGRRSGIVLNFTCFLNYSCILKSLQLSAL